MSSRMKLSFHREEKTPDNIFPDFDWVRENRKALNEQYGDVVLVVYQKKLLVWGKPNQKLWLMPSPDWLIL